MGLRTNELRAPWLASGVPAGCRKPPAGVSPPLTNTERLAAVGAESTTAAHAPARTHARPALTGRPWRPWLISIAVTLAYLFALPVLHDAWGAGATSLSVLSVAAVAWSFGQRAGIAAGASAIVIDAVILGLLGEPDRLDVVMAAGGLVSIADVLVGATFGWMGEVTGRLADQSRQLEVLTDEAMRRRIESETLGEAARLVAESPLSGETLQTILEAAMRVVPARLAALALPVDANTLEIAAVSGAPGRWLGTRYATTQGIAGRAFRTRAPQVVHDVATDPDYVRWVDGIRAALSVPIVSRGAVAGVLHLEANEFARFNTREAQLLQAFAAFAAIAIESERLLRDSASRTQELTAANARLRASEVRLQAVVGNAPVALFALDAEGRFSLAEGKALKALGLRSGDVFGRAVSEVYRDNPDILLNVRLALEGQETRAIVRVGGSAFEVLCIPQRDHDAVTGVIGVALDVSERVRQETQLKEQLALYDAVMRSQSDLGEILIVSEGSRPVFWNQAFLDLSGYSGEELATMTSLFELVVPEEREALMARVRANSGSRMKFEIGIRAKDGRRVDLEVAMQPFRSPDRTGTVTVARDISERKRAQSTLEHQALHDVLTSLPNRMLLRDRLEQAVSLARRQRSSVSLLMMDLDHFKEINDTFGHHVGDALLQQVGPRLRTQIRETDTVARLGGDEFALVLVGADAAGAELAARHVLEQLERPFLLEGQSLDIGASIGIAIFPDHGDDADMLLRRADIAMYAAKRSRVGYARYAAEQDEYSPSRLALMSDLRAGIERSELVLHFQPVVAVPSGAVMGLEALVRWQHSERGLVPPADFVPLAERSGLIRPLTQWVLTAALREARTLRQNGMPVGVSVNLSTRNLLDPELADLVQKLLETWQVDPKCLSLEITESNMVTEPQRTLDVLAQLRRIGVRLAVDDFGTGYSSLQYLNRLPVDAIKIDKTFVRAMTGSESSAAIVRATVDLGHNLGFTVVAEGVEDRATWDALAAATCDEVQGFFIARAMPADDLRTWLRAHAAASAAIGD